jgi:hypothetical protein
MGNGIGTEGIRCTDEDRLDRETPKTGRAGRIGAFFSLSGASEILLSALCKP